MPSNIFREEIIILETCQIRPIWGPKDFINYHGALAPVGYGLEPHADSQKRRWRELCWVARLRRGPVSSGGSIPIVGGATSGRVCDARRWNGLLWVEIAESGATSLALANECCSPVGPSRGASDSAVPPGGAMSCSSGEASDASRRRLRACAPHSRVFTILLITLNFALSLCYRANFKCRTNLLFGLTISNNSLSNYMFLNKIHAARPWK